MITLAAPLGLLALAAFAVPLLVHLWRPPPRTVRLGSLRFLREGARRPVRNLRWRELLRLALRLLLLATLALLLARPWWNRPAASGSKWALRSPEAILAGEAENAWRSLLAEGFEPRWLAPGFPRTRPADPELPADPWSLLAEADALLPAAGELAVAASPRLADLRSNRPELSRSVRWIESTAPERGPSRPLKAEPPVRVGVRADSDRAEDARRVTAALRAIAASGTPAFEIVDSAEAGKRPIDWLIALGDVPVPPGSANVLRDADPNSESFAIATTFAGERLRRRVVSKSPGLVLARDGFGDPIASEQRTRDAREIRLETRFHPDWMDAASSSALAVWLRDLLAPRADSISPQDQRRAAGAQAHPAVRSGAEPRVVLPVSQATELTSALWLLALFLFALERAWNVLR